MVEGARFGEVKSVSMPGTGDLLPRVKADSQVGRRPGKRKVSTSVRKQNNGGVHLEGVLAVEAGAAGTVDIGVVVGEWETCRRVA